MSIELMNHTRASGSDIRPEYDISRAAIGKYAARYAQGTNVVLLDADVVALFPDSKSVNDALRSLVKIADVALEQHVGDYAAEGRSGQAFRVEPATVHGRLSLISLR